MFFKKRLEEYYKKQLLIKSQSISALVNEMENYIDKKRVEILDYKIYLQNELNSTLLDLQKKYQCEQKFFKDLENKLLVYSQLYFNQQLMYKQRESIYQNRKLFHGKMELINNYQKIYEECIAESNELIEILSEEADMRNHFKLLSIQNPDLDIINEESIQKQYEKILSYLIKENPYLLEVRFLLQDIWKENSSWQKELNTLKIYRYQNLRQKKTCKEARAKLLDWNQLLKSELEEVKKRIEEIKAQEKESRNEIIELWKEHMKESDEYALFQKRIDSFHMQIDMVNNHKSELYKEIEKTNDSTAVYLRDKENEKNEREKLYLKMKQYEQSIGFLISDNKRLKAKKADYIDRIHNFKIQLDEYYSMKNRKWETVNYYKDRHEAVPNFDSIMSDINLYTKKISERRGYIESYGRDVDELKRQIGKNQEEINKLNIIKEKLFNERNERKARIGDINIWIEQNNQKCEELRKSINKDKEKIGVLYMQIQEQNEYKKEFMNKHMQTIRELLMQCEKLLS